MTEFTMPQPPWPGRVSTTRSQVCLMTETRSSRLTSALAAATLNIKVMTPKRTIKLV